MFKKIILVIISLAAAGTLGYFLSNLVHDKATSPESLPENALSFITEHFQDEKIAFAKEDRDLLKISYEIVLTDGTKLEFRRNGELKEINRHRNSIPDGIIPQAAADKVNELYPDSFITKSEYDDGELELKTGQWLRTEIRQELQSCRTRPIARIIRDKKITNQ